MDLSTNPTTKESPPAMSEQPCARANAKAWRLAPLALAAVLLLMHAVYSFATMPAVVESISCTISVNELPKAENNATNQEALIALTKENEKMRQQLEHALSELHELKQERTSSMLRGNQEKLSSEESKNRGKPDAAPMSPAPGLTATESYNNASKDILQGGSVLGGALEKPSEGAKNLATKSTGAGGSNVPRLDSILFERKNSPYYKDQQDIRSLYTSPDTTQMQPWLREYFEWHLEMRHKFPGSQLLDHPDAPKVWIRACLAKTHPGRKGANGGLHDRMGLLENDVYLAAKLKRILLFYWEVPYPLEEFLQPNIIDWTVPKSSNMSNPDLLASKVYRTLQYAKSPKKRYEKLQVSNEKILAAWGNVPDIASSIEEERRTGSSSIAKSDAEFGMIWNLLFKPAPLFEQELLQVMQQKHLRVNQYVATHCRVRHPIRYSKKDVALLTSKTNTTTDVDKGGIAFEGRAKEIMLNVATHAMNCTNLLRTSSEEPIYFFSDSEDLVQYMTEPTADAGTEDSQQDSPSERRSQQIKAALSGTVVSRDVVSTPSHHLDMFFYTRGNVQSFYGTFIDLYLGIGARCLSYGVGNYAYLASRISNTQCLQTYEQVGTKAKLKWNLQGFARAAACPIPSYK